MNTFIKENERFLRICFSALRISGWLLLVISLCSPVVSIVLLRNYESGIEQVIITWLLIGFSLMFLGLLGIGLAQLIRYLLDSNYRPGFILRHGDKFIYAYVILTLVAATKHIFDSVRFLGMSIMEGQLTILLSNSITQAVYLAAKAFILLGIAQLLKRLMPIMYTFKTW